METRTTFYEAIGSWRSMPFHQMEECYKQTLRAHHPDAHIGAAEDVVAAHNGIYVRATEAWSVLGTRLRRSAYDKLCYTLGRECPTCKGKGCAKYRTNSSGERVVTQRQMAPLQTCLDCQGTGFILTAKTWPETEAL